jgi:hypothetical protein
MWVNIVLGGYAGLAAVVAVWSARVAFRQDSKSEVRNIAYKIFRLVWPSAALSAAVTILRLHEGGLL